MSQFHSLTVSNIVKETDDCVSIYFDIPTEIKKDFSHKAGQYLTLKSDINGEDVRRAYSICTAPEEQHLGVSVKEVPNGKMSTFLNKRLNVGDTLEVMSPEGKFVIIPNHLEEKVYYFFAAGSGITPIMSMIKTVLEHEPRSICHLLYGNRNENSIIFKDTLDTLCTKYKGQLTVVHVLSNPIKHKKKGLLGAFSKGKIAWTGETGRINDAIIKKWIDKQPSSHIQKEYYLCGPGGMITTSETYLLQNGVSEDNIHIEYFSAPEKKDTHTVVVASNEATQMEAKLEGDTYNISIDKNKTILENMIDHKIDAPYSCTSGACSTCMAKVTEGAAVMEVCFALDDSEIKDGYVLTCQAKATSDTLKLNFDV